MKKTNIGGEALIEGVMMRGPKSIGMAIRKPDGDITVEIKEYIGLAQRNKFLGLPVIRGMIGFFESLIVGMKALTYSAEFMEIEEESEKPSRFDTFLQKVFGDKLQDAVIYFSVIIAVIMGVGLFMLLPHFVAGLGIFKGMNSTLLNLFEGVIRVLIFMGYIMIISGLKDIQRVFQYHGAEHKTIHCYENEEELTVENVKKYPTLHPRCGTSFLLIVMIVSIVVFAFLGWQENLLLRVLPRLLLLPLVAGLSYEVIRYAGKSDSKIIRMVSLPGLGLQKFTTREPDDMQIETAIAALTSVIPENKGEQKE